MASFCVSAPTGFESQVKKRWLCENFWLLQKAKNTNSVQPLPLLKFDTPNMSSCASSRHPFLRFYVPCYKHSAPHFSQNIWMIIRLLAALSSALPSCSFCNQTCTLEKTLKYVNNFLNMREVITSNQQQLNNFFNPRGPPAFAA